jgi:hypothetical protein
MYEKPYSSPSKTPLLLRFDAVSPKVQKPDLAVPSNRERVGGIAIEVCESYERIWRQSQGRSRRYKARLLLAAFITLACNDSETKKIDNGVHLGTESGGNSSVASGAANVGGRHPLSGTSVYGGTTNGLFTGKDAGGTHSANGGISSVSSAITGGEGGISGTTATLANAGRTSTGGKTSNGTGGAFNGGTGSMAIGGTGIGTGTTSVVIPSSDCQAFWNFETLADGKIPDISGHGITLSTKQASIVSGPRGNYLKLVGTDSSATASAPVIDTTKNFSISTWVSFDQLSSYNTIVSQDGQSVSSFYVQTRSSGRIAFTTFPSDNTSATGCITEGAVQPKTGEWYHVVATRHATTREQRLYIDGMLSGTTTCNGGFTTTSPLIVGRGRWQDPADWTTGGVDELCVLNRVITKEEAIDLYQAGRPTGKNYLFAYFAEQAKGRGDGLRLAHSHNALDWGAIGVGKVFLAPTVGGKSFRDPHVMRDPKGIYHVVWTTSCVPWAESGCVQDKGFGHAQSSDLVRFSEPTYVPISLNVEHVWAPETIYDSVNAQYMVYWSSPIDNNPSASDPHSIYYILTKDFVTFSAPAVLYAKSGRDFIDATITADPSGGYLMFLKDEANGQKNIRALHSSTLYGEGSWTGEPSNPLTGNYAAEGPSALLVNNQMYVFFDKYGDGAYGALRSNGLTNLTAPASWADISSSVFFAGVRHGTPIEVPAEVYRAVAMKAGE